MLLGLHHRITTANSVKISRTDCLSNPSVPRNFRARLATRLIRTHSREDLCGPAVAGTSRSLAVVSGCMSRYLSAGNGRSDFHILLFNEHSAPPSSRALNWLTCDASSPPVIWTPISVPHRPRHHPLVLASSQAQRRVERSTWGASLPAAWLDTEAEEGTGKHLLTSLVWKY